MKLMKLIAILGVSLLSLPCFANSTILCSEPANDISTAQSSINRLLEAQFLSNGKLSGYKSDTASAPSIIKVGEQYVICVTETMRVTRSFNTK